MRSIVRVVVVTVGLALVLSLLGGVGEAFAEMPWWHVTTMSSPASATSDGAASMLIDVSNLGDRTANGFEQPITVTDTLPAGVTPSAVYPRGGGGVLGQSYAPFLASCGIEGQKVSCTYSLPVLAYEDMVVLIEVRVAPGAGHGVNEVGVSGGGALPLVSHHELALEGTSTPYGVDEYELSPEEEGGGPDTQAGSHPFQLTSTAILNTHVTVAGEPSQQPEVLPVAFTKDLRFNLPPGLVGNPTPLPKCSARVFAEGVARQGQPGAPECPEDTVVGVAKITVVVSGLLIFSTPLYSLEPAVGEPARFGFSGGPVGPVILDTSVRTGGDYGVVVTVPNITQVPLIANQVTFWGVSSDTRHDTARGSRCLTQFEAPVWELPCPVSTEQPLLIMPTSCTGPLQTSLEADSWATPGAFTAPRQYSSVDRSGEPYGLDGCNRLNFEPSVSLTPDGQAASTPTGLTVGVHIPQDAGLNPVGLADSTVKDTTVTLPSGVALNPAAADGLMSCSLEEIGLDSASEQSCPEASKVGTLEIHTPLLPDPLVGAAYLASQNANPFGSLVAMYLVAKDPVSGVLVKLAGEVKPDPVTGQLVATFKETPQLPFEDLALHFFGGSRAPLGTPALCGAYTTTASIAPWAGNPPVDSSSTFNITSGPNGSPCSSPLPFDPSLTTGSLNIQAGAFTPFTLTMSREDGEQSLSSIELHIPAGLSGTLAGVKLCPEAQANEGTCGPESLIGETTVSVGLGGSPFTVKGGKVYITEKYKGAPFGLSIVNPAKAGPFDLENTPTRKPACDCIVVRAKIEVDPTTSALTVTSDPPGSPYSIPTVIEGIPLHIKHVNVTIDRPEFTFNPTSCEKHAVTGTLFSAEGTNSALSVPFQVTNCATLSFKPQFSVSTPGKPSRTNGIGLDVKLSYPKAPFGSQANVAKVRVELPKQLPSRLTTLQKACPDSIFDANPANCPAASKVGEATAISPLVPVTLHGPAYFVSHGGAAFPELIIVLSGYGITVYLHGETFISKEGVTSSTFNTVPDVPIDSFELKLPAGPDSALAANDNPCASKLVMPTSFTAQNGVTLQQQTNITVEGCKPTLKVIRHSAKGKTATIVVNVPSAGRLSGGGGGLTAASKQTGKAGNVTLELVLSKSSRNLLKRHPDRKLMAHVTLHFAPAHGGPITSTVAVLIG